MCRALDFATRLALVTAAPDPTPPELRGVRAKLRGLDYCNVAVLDVLCHIERCGSARGSEAIDDEDLPAIESLIPADERPEHECHDSCLVCRDESDFRRRLLRPSGAMRKPDDSDLERREAF